MQMLWDRAEADGYAEQMTSGLPGTPPHQVLLEEAFGDHQVANVATETEARTIGARLHEPALAPGRSAESQPFWDLATFHAPSGSPALFVWDTGVPPAAARPTGRRPERPRSRTTRRRARSPPSGPRCTRFFTSGQVTDPCGSGPCTGPRPS